MGYKVQLTGTLLGVESCYIATDRDEVRVGSALDADLVVLDPLVPPMAFVVRRYKWNGAESIPNADRWIAEAHPQTRLFVNERLTVRESLVFGDTIASGCHRFVFARADTLPRNRNSSANVNDVFATLLRNHSLPPAFLQDCPWHRHALRLRRALTSAIVLAGVVTLLLLIARPSPTFEPIQFPLEVTVMSDRMQAPPPEAVRSLKDVKRQTFAPGNMPEIATPDAPHPTLANPRDEVLTVNISSPAMFPAPQIAKTHAEIAALAPTELKGGERRPGTIPRDPIRLAYTAPTRRLTISEAADANTAQLQPAAVRFPPLPACNATTVSVDEDEGIRVSDRRVLDRDRIRRLETLAAFRPSPVRYEDADGFQVPVAQLSEALAPMESVKTGDYQIDGKVTESEAAKSWKSGRFRVHAPGNPPPEADPATYCYVGRSEADGKPSLYISFICSDPNVDQIVANVTHNLPLYANFPFKIIYDDSVEIFMDTNNDRRDYYQMIINARGAYWSAYWPSQEEYERYEGRPWDPQATVKTSINKEAGQWVCEILIPFERLGGIPAKGTRWTINFCRNFRGQGADWQLQTWFEVYDKARNFHRPDKFGMFEW